MSNIVNLRGKQPENEKITINLGFVDLGRIDLLVQEGFYSNRSDLIRTAIRKQLDAHGEAVDRSIERLRELEPRLVPWALGANGGASVIASILCIVVAMQAGFRSVSLLAAAVYLLGTWVFTSGPLAPRRAESRR